MSDIAETFVSAKDRKPRECDKCHFYKPDVMPAPDVKMDLCNKCWSETPPRGPWRPRAS